MLSMSKYERYFGSNLLKGFHVFAAFRHTNRTSHDAGQRGLHLAFSQNAPAPDRYLRLGSDPAQIRCSPLRLIQAVSKRKILRSGLIGEQQNDVRFDFYNK